MTQYLVYDVFTQSRYGGNSLAVVLDASDLAESDLQLIAREFNLPETTFVYPPNDPANTARVRIFTPVHEMDFAGHPTVGTALALHQLGRAGDRMTLELGVGPIPVEINGDSARFETSVPLTTRPGVSVDRMAELVGIAPGSITNRAHPPINAGVGTEFLIAEVADEDALSAADANIQAFREEIAAGNLRLGCYIYVRRGQVLKARMFAPTKGIPEDPATGSAAAGLVALLGQIEGKDQAFTIHQGVEMGRPSVIEATVTVESAPARVSIAGCAVKVMEGKILT